ncbi:MAG TPA: class I SAM-dependent methyltransferase [Acidimicrobiia bacterium]|nr:class I SAM-dependent methyltransferase [Acidimicrobiia bacterium]
MGDHQRDVWDQHAATFDDEADHGLRDPVVRGAWRTLLRSVLPDPPVDIADLGSGTGSLSVLLAQDGYRVVGVDFSQNMVAAAERKATEAGVSVEFRKGDAALPDIEPSSLDVVLVRHVVWALDAPEDAIRRWAALLRGGGRLVLIEGRWSTGTGVSARELVSMVRTVIPDVEERPLTDPALWGAPVLDERYVLIART